MTLNIFTTVKYYDELLQKVKILFAKYINKKCLNAAITMYACNERAVSARLRRVMDAVKALCERHVYAVGTLWGRCAHAITGIFDI